MTPLLKFSHPDCLCQLDNTQQRGSVSVSIFANTLLCEFYPHNTMEVVYTSLGNIQTGINDQYWKETEVFENTKLFVSNLKFS